MTPWTAACQAFVSFTILQSLLKFMSIESMMSSNPLFFWCPLLLLPSILPSIRVFSKVLGRQLHRGVSSPAYRKKRKGQSALLEPVIFQVPLAQKKKNKKKTWPKWPILFLTYSAPFKVSVIKAVWITGSHYWFLILNSCPFVSKDIWRGNSLSMHLRL